jgi:diguanylate cyclase (GGDEF)-like protein
MTWSTRPRRASYGVAAALLLACAGCASDTSQAPIQSLASAWAFHPGDELAWARPDFDDRAWTRIRVPGSWRREGFDDLVGLAWYRLHLPAQWTSRTELGVTLGKIDSAYELYAGGRAVGGVGRLPPDPRMEYDRHRTYAIPVDARNADGSIDLALRVWRNPAKWSTAAGPVEGPFEAGPLVQLIEREKLVDARELALVFLFVTIAAYHLSLRIRLGQGDDYLWFAVSALLAAAYGFLRTQWKYLLVDDFILLKKIEHVVLWLIPAAIVQFLWVFFRRPRPRWIQGIQAATVLGALVVAVAPGILVALALLPIVQFWTLPLTVGALGLVVDRWRANDREATVVGLASAVLSATIVHDALVDRNLLTDPRIGLYGFAFLALAMSISLGNRFQRALRERDALLVDLESRVESRTRELHDAYHKMEQLALRDGLTQMLNRRAIRERAERELARARRHGTPFALALVDVDSFKAVNDTFGHAAGDVVLGEVARRLLATVRASDDVGRWGGEEFLVVLVATGLAEAERAGERLRAAIGDAPFALADDVSRTVTISVGLAVAEAGRSDAFDLDRVIERADRALYRAKTDGRNRVHIDARVWP